MERIFLVQGLGVSFECRESRVMEVAKEIIERGGVVVLTEIKGDH